MNSQTELRIKCSKDSYGFWYREHHWRWVDGEALSMTMMSTVQQIKTAGWLSREAS